MLEGKKTMTGGILLIIAGGLYIGGLYDVLLYDIAIGIALMGAGLVGIGIQNCIARGVFNVHDGKIMHKSSRVPPYTVMGE